MECTGREQVCDSLSRSAGQLSKFLHRYSAPSAPSARYIRDGVLGRTI